MEEIRKGRKKGVRVVDRLLRVVVERGGRWDELTGKGREDGE